VGKFVCHIWSSGAGGFSASVQPLDSPLPRLTDQTSSHPTIQNAGRTAAGRRSGGSTSTFSGSWGWSGSGWDRRYGTVAGVGCFDGSAYHVKHEWFQIAPYAALNTWLNQVVERLELLSMEGDDTNNGGYYRLVGAVTAAEVRLFGRMSEMSQPSIHPPNRPMDRVSSTNPHIHTGGECGGLSAHSTPSCSCPCLCSSIRRPPTPRPQRTQEGAARRSNWSSTSSNNRPGGSTTRFRLLEIRRQGRKAHPAASLPRPRPTGAAA
jgi:hypothetical protein